MAQPITWQNVSDGGAAGNAARPLYYANESINRGFQNLGDLIGSVESNDRKNWIQQKSNNTQEFLDALSKYKTPEELAAAQADGSLDAMRQGYGAQVNRDEVRDAQQNRMNYLRDSILKAQSYDRTQNELAYAPLVDAYKAAKLKGTPEGEAEAERILTNFPGMPNKADTMMFGRNIDRQDNSDQQTDETHQVAMAKAPLERAQIIANTDATRAGIGLTNAQAANVPVQGQINLTDALTRYQQADTQAEQSARANAAAGAKGSAEAKAKAIERLKEDMGVSSGFMGTEEGQQAFMKGLQARGLPQRQIEDILYNHSKYFSNGGVVVGKDKDGNEIRMPIPVSDALSAVDKSTDSVPFGFSRRGDDYANILQDRFGDMPVSFGIGNNKNQDKARIDQIKSVLSAQPEAYKSLMSPQARAILGGTPGTTTVTNPITNDGQVVPVVTDADRSVAPGKVDLRTIRGQQLQNLLKVAEKQFGMRHHP